MEDGWLLARVIEYTRSNSNPNPDSLAKALEIFNTFRSPYYLRMSVLFMRRCFPPTPVC